MNTRSASEKLMDAYDSATGDAKAKLREVIVSELSNSTTYYPLVTRPWYPDVNWPKYPTYPTITWTGASTGGNVTTVPYSNQGSTTVEVNNC